jgi:hypothetical protein
MLQNPRAFYVAEHDGDFRGHLASRNRFGKRDKIRALAGTEDAEAEVRMKGDDIFGRRLSITYFRELTAEEAECEARYGGETLPDGNADIDELREQLDKIPFERKKRRAA